MRRSPRWLSAMLALVLAALPAIAADYAAVLPGQALSFPRDEGSHPGFRIEWWYVTGWIEDEAGTARGFQVTFFRHRSGLDPDNPSRFAARQLLFAHAAVSDPERGTLLHDERAARAGFGLAEAGEGRVDLVLEDWSLQQAGDRYMARIPASGFSLELELERVQPPLLQGSAGFSQKGPSTASSSYYYSLPQLEVSGRLTLAGVTRNVQGKAWFDHEWSSSLMDEAASGWDWLGINLDDGSALMAFRMRDAQGNAHWAGGSLRTRGGQKVFTPAEVEWVPGRTWRSPRTGIDYPVEWRVRAGEQWFNLRPLFDDQESDSRRSTGTIYWEGAVELATADGEVVGRGYLELTGYGTRLRL